MKPAAPLVLLALLLAAAAAAIALTTGGGGPGVPGVAEAPLPGDADEFDAAPAALLGAAPAEAAEATVAPAGAQRQQVVAFPSESGGPTLRVIEAGGRSVPFAEVFVGEGGGEWRARTEGRMAHWAAVLEQEAPARRADARGEVSLPPVRRRLFVAGRAAGLFGATIVQEGQGQPVLELRPDKTLRVRVLDAAGEPVEGLRVLLGAELGDGVQRVAGATTAGDGLALLPHVQLFEVRMPQLPPNEQRLAQRTQEVRVRMAQFEARVQAARAAVDRGLEAELRQMRDQQRAALEELMAVERLQREQARTREIQARASLMGQVPPEAQGWPLADFVVFAAVPLLQPAYQRVPATAIPPGIVELRLPATGAVEVRVLAPDGGELQTPCRVSVHAADGGRLPDVRLRSLDPQSAVRGEKPLGGGAVRLAPVGLGLRLRVAVEFADNDFDFALDDVPGPTSPAPLLIVARAPGWFLAVTGRLVDGQGAPLSGVAAEMFVAGAKGRVERERVVADAAGRFELPVRLREPAPPYTLEVQAERGERRVGRLLPVPQLAPGGRAELGDVVLAELTLLAGGRVADDLGQPLPGAEVAVQALRGEAWVDESFLRTSTDGEGAFALFGEARPQQLRLVATRRGHARAEARIACGERVDLVLPRNGGIRAEGFVPPFVSREMLVARLIDPATGQARDLGVRRPQPDRFELRADELRPGEWQLALQVRGLPRPLGFAERVVVPPGGTARPPALDGLDLRGRLFQFQVRAVDAAGRPLGDPGAPLFVELHDDRGLPQLVPFAWRGGRIELVADQPSLSVVGIASGCRPVRALLQAGEGTLTFARAQPLRLRLPGLRALLGAEQAARISLVFQGSTGLPEVDVQAVDQRGGEARGYPRAALGKAGGASLGGGDEVTVALVFDGPYEVVLRLDGPGGRVSRRIGALHAILDGPEPPSLTVFPNADAVRAALAELRARPPAERRR